NWLRLRIGTNGNTVDPDKDYANDLIASGNVGYGLNQYDTFSRFTSNSWEYTFTGARKYDGRFRYIYDNLDRVVRIKTANGSDLIAEYFYDPQNRRVEKVIHNTSNGNVIADTAYVYDGWNVLDEHTEGHYSQRYLWSGGRLVSI